MKLILPNSIEGDSGRFGHKKRMAAAFVAAPTIGVIFHIVMQEGGFRVNSAGRNMAAYGGEN